MKKLFLFVALLLVTGFATKIMAQSTVTGTTAGVNIITPIILTQDQVLYFGTMSVQASLGGTCVLPSNSVVRTQTGGVNLSILGAPPTNAAYHVSGNASTSYALTLPNTITVTTTAGGGASMTISLLKARFNGASSDAVTSVLSSGGTDNFTVGGTLTVDAGQIPGAYTGTFDVTVAYN